MIYQGWWRSIPGQSCFLQQGFKTGLFPIVYWMAVLLPKSSVYHNLYCYTWDTEHRAGKIKASLHISNHLSAAYDRSNARKEYHMNAQAQEHSSPPTFSSPCLYPLHNPSVHTVHHRATVSMRGMFQCNCSLRKLTSQDRCASLRTHRGGWRRHVMIQVSFKLFKTRKQTCDVKTGP